MEFSSKAKPQFVWIVKKKFERDMIKGMGIKAFIYKFFMCKLYSHCWYRYLVQ